MATEFLMPKLGLTMEEGTITEWLVADGALVTAGTPLLRIETDKTETDVEAAGTGRVHRVGQIGETFACGDRIGWFLDDGEAAPGGSVAPTAPAVAAAPAPAPAAAEFTDAAEAPVAAPSGNGRIFATPLTRRLASERNIDLRTVRGTGPGGRIIGADLDDLPAAAPVSAAPAAPAQRSQPAPMTGSGTPATAAARQLAELLGLDVQRIPVDPDDGRVTRESVARHVRQLLASPPPAAAETPKLLPALQEPTRTVRMSGMRGTIAKRMHESLRQMAQLTLFMDADLDAVVADRARRKEAGDAPSYTDYVVAATARALVRHPLANSQITDDGLVLLPAVHVGLAVALDDGLVVPVIRDAAHRDLSSLATEARRLATAARSGSLSFADLEGGTCSVSALGAFGVDGFTPVINPPNTAIIGVGRLRDDVVLDGDGQVAVRQRLTLSLTWDHRAFDGAPAAAFCRTITELLADPAQLDAPAT